MLSKGGESISVDPWFINKKYPYKQMPVFILKEPYWSRLTNDGIVLYMTLYNLAQLSYENSKGGKYWINSDGEVFVHCTLQAAQNYLKCGHDKAAKVLRELEDAGLIKKRSRGNGRPAEIILLEPAMGFDFFEPPVSEKPKLEVLESRSYRLGKADTIHTDKTAADKISENHLHQKRYKRKDVEDEIKENICYDVLLSDFPEYQGALQAILEAMVNTICSEEALVRIGKQEYDRDRVRESFLQLMIWIFVTSLTKLERWISQ